MTTGDAIPNLGRFGVFGRGASPEQAKQIEDLGYGAIWVGGSPAAELSFVEPLLEPTSTLKVATGIVNIWTAAAEPVAESFHRINIVWSVGHRRCRTVLTERLCLHGQAVSNQTISATLSDALAGQVIPHVAESQKFVSHQRVSYTPWRH